MRLFSKDSNLCFFLFIVQCDELEITSGMTKKYKSDGIHSIVEFSCDTGYTLVGAGVAVCNDTGVWSIESQPICGMYKKNNLNVPKQVQ